MDRHFSPLSDKTQLGAPVAIHYLDGALHANRMSKNTLDAMMSAIAEAKPLGQRALKLQARALKVDALHPCDLLAPPPAFQGARRWHARFAYCPSVCSPIAYNP